MRFIAVGAFLFVMWAVTSAQAQQLDSRWTPWLGCWQLDGESVRVCVAAAADAGGVTLKTYVDSAAEEPAADAVLEQTLVAGRGQHPIAEAECRGWQQADWSRTGERLFARAELTCNDATVRTVSGLSMIAGGGTWIDIQGIAIAGRENIRVRRYHRGTDRAGGARSDRRLTGVAPHLGATAFTIDDVKEASARVSARVVEAALVETSAGFDLSSRILLDLERAGVAAGVIDTMVALSYPSHFIVDRPGSQTSAAFAPVDFGDASFGAWPFPYYGTSYGAYYDTYGSPFWSPYFYSPFGYAYWGSYGGYFPYGSLVPAAGFVSIADPSAGNRSDGRVIDGVGYTRIRTREAADRPSDSSASSGTSSTTGSSSIPWSGGSSGVSSGGYSDGSSGGDSGRTAQPR